MSEAGRDPPDMSSIHGVTHTGIANEAHPFANRREDAPNNG